MMRPHKLLLTILLLFAPVTFVAAQTGKIAGQVTDANTGEALPGVNVVIEGTTQGTTTDVDGYYTIINLRPGTYNLRASFVGYTPAVVENVEVNIDLTTEVDFPLQEETVGLDEVVVVATQPVIQRDIAASQRNINAEEIQSAPLQNVTNILTAQVGSNDVSAYADRPELRGSSFRESIFLVDGVNQGDALNNQPHFQVNLDAVEEVKVQTGGFSAEYGNVRSGVINVVTKEGGERYSGSINARYSPPGYKHFGPGPFDHDSPLVVPFVSDAAGAFEGGNDFFNGWNAIAQELAESGEAHGGQPMELYARYLWRHRSQDSINRLKELEQQGIVQFADNVDPDDLVWHQTGVVPDYSTSVTLGGPLPVLSSVKFFASYDRKSQEYAYRFPQRSYVDDNFRGKLTTNLIQGMKLMLHGYYSTQSGGDGGQGPGIGGFVSSNPFGSTGGTNKAWYPHCAVPGTRIRQIYGGRLTHALSAKTFYEINLTHDRVDYEMEMELRNTAPIPGSGGITSSSKTSGSGIDGGRIGTEAEADSRASSGQEGWENWRDWALIKIGDHWYDEAPKGYGPVNWRDITGYYRMESCNLREDQTNSRSWDLSGAITSQVNRHNNVKAGFKVRMDQINMYYEAIDPSVNAGNVWHSEVDPISGAVYAQDKLEYQGFVAEIGLRFDWMSTGGFPTVLEDCDLENASACVGDSGPYSQWLAAGNTMVDKDGGRILGTRESVFQENIGTKRVTHTRLSPRIGISHPITTVAKIFLNYGHFYQWPDATDQYYARFDTRRGFRLRQLGNPLLEPARTIQYEVGYEHNLFDRMLLRLTGYYKDINAEIDDVRIYPLGFGGGRYDTWLNMEFRDTRGFESFLELQRGVLPYFSGWASVNYMVESGAEYGYERFYEDPSRQARLAGTQVSNPDVRPIFKANFNFGTPSEWYGPMLGDVSLLGGLNISLLYTWRRGAQFTWNPAELPLVEDNVRWRPYQRFDLRLTKDIFRQGNLRSTFYIDVTNLFDHTNMSPFSGGVEEGGSSGWAWSSHQWWRDQQRKYMESLGYTAANQNDDGSFDNTIGRPGDGELGDTEIDMPGFSPWTFLGKRDVYFGIRFYF